MATEPLTQAQLELISAETERAASKSLRRYVLGSVLTYIVLLCVALAVEHGQAQTLKEGLDGSCRRVNTLRAQSNKSDAVIFKILSSSGRREASLAKATHGKEGEAHRRSADTLFSSATGLTVTALTDCKQAVSDPEAYITPVATPIGVPQTGELSKNVKEVVVSSDLYLLEQR